MTKKIKLTSQQKSVLILKGVGTFLLLVVMELMFLALLLSVISGENLNTLFSSNIFFFLKRYSLLEIAIIVVFLLTVINIFATYKVVRQHFRRFEIQHIILELQKIAQGNLNHTIDLTVSDDLQRIVDTTNLLITNTSKLVADERKIEKSKDELITNVSHDIRTPLTSIIGYLGLIESSANLSKEDIDRYTHIAYLKSQQMQTLVNDLFDYTNSQFNDSTINASEFDMAQLLEQFAAEYEIEAKRRNIEIIVNTEPKVLKMSADTDKLGRVFNNLISNAFKYGENAQHIWLEAVKKNDKVVVKVSNDGKKIPQNSLDQLFERFYRVEESRSKETGGTGLGLAIAQGIIKMHGGKIFAESDDTKTSFVINLPASPKKISEVE